MASIGISAPCLSSRAMLCSLSISQWSASKHDRQASEEIAAHHGAQPDVGRYNKLLIPKETLAEVRRLAGEALTSCIEMNLKTAYPADADVLYGGSSVKLGENTTS